MDGATGERGKSGNVGDDIAAASTAEFRGHQRMLRALSAIRDRSGGNYFFGGDILQTALQNVAMARQSGNLQYAMVWHGEAAKRFTLMGQPDEAIVHANAARDCANRMDELRPNTLPNELFASIDYLHALAAFRKAENENCIHCTDGEGCLFPISSLGVHTKKEGATDAVKYLGRVLDRMPDNHAAIWLLNIANMTLGTFPDGVPPKFRLDESKLTTSEDFPKFPNVATKLGIDTLSLSGGVLAEDFDGDDHLDFVVSDWHVSGQMKFFHGAGDGTFEDRTEQANLLGIFGGLQTVQADYDNDGDCDVLVLRGAWNEGENGFQPNSLLQNDGKGRFWDVTFDAGLAAANFPTQNAAFADFDGDGDLDLHIGNEAHPNQLFVNDGKGHFTDVAASAGVDDASYTKGCVWGDANGDGLPDLYVSNLDAENRLFINQGNGRFVDEAKSRGVTQPGFGFATWFWDVDNDGDLDLMALGYQRGVQYMLADYVKSPKSLGLTERGEDDRLYLNDGTGVFRDAAPEMGLTATTQPMGCNFGDLDNDGFLDFYLGTGEPNFEALMPNLMYRNLGGERFVDVTVPGGFGHLQKGHGVAFADFDEDGDQDVLMELGGAFEGDRFNNALFQNPGFGNHWIKIRLIGETSNRSAIGAQIKLVIREGETQREIYRWVGQNSSFGGNPLLQEIGLGQANLIDSIEVVWPTSGKRQRFEDVDVDQRLRIEESDESWQDVIAVGESPIQ